MLLLRLEQLFTRVEGWLPETPAVPQWDRVHASRWRRQHLRGYFQSVPHLHCIRLADLHGVDAQKEHLERNTRQFLHGLPANNALLWGAKGTGKSSLVKALLNEYAEHGLRLVELDGSISAPPDNVLIYATSNRRHLLPEYQRENREACAVDGEIHPGEATEEKISLSERFGLWLSFYPFKQDEYLAIVNYWVAYYGADPDWPELRQQALQWALARGSRSGRAAWQFAREWVGQEQLDAMNLTTSEGKM